MWIFRSIFKIDPLNRILYNAFMIKAIFFDLDETLIAVMEQHREANRKAFAEFGVDFGDIQKKTKEHEFLGKRLSDILRIMLSVMKIPEEKIPLKNLLAKRQKYFLELVKKNGTPLPGAKEAIITAKEKNKKVAIVSSGTRKYINLVIDLFQLSKYIDFIIGEEDVLRGKPFPDCYEKAYKHIAKEGDIKKDECLVVEDSFNGVTAGKNAGLPVCFIPFFPPKEFPKNVDYYLTSLKEFNTLLL